MISRYITLTLLTLAIMTGCTYSVNFIQTNGTASDMVDEVQEPTSNINPKINIPS